MQQLQPAQFKTNADAALVTATNAAEAAVIHIKPLAQIDAGLYNLVENANGSKELSQ